LRRKLKALERGGWSFEQPEDDAPDPADLPEREDLVSAASRYLQ